MKINKLKRFISSVLCLSVLAANIGFTTYYAYAAGDDDAAATFFPTADAFASGFSGQNVTVMVNSKSDKLIIGKFRHAYLRFDLSSVDTGNIDDLEMVLYLQQTHGSNTFVITECEEELTTGEKWEVDNITYNNRPEDIEDSPTLNYDVGVGSLSLDVSDILKNALESGRTEVNIHISTTEVNDSTVAASEVYSSRSSVSVPYLEIISSTSEAETPVDPEFETTDMGSYYNNGNVASKIFKIKSQSTGNYIEVDEATGRLSLTSEESDAATFAMYIFDYYTNVDYDETEEYGAAITTYAIKCLDNDKFLTFQNYFEEDDASKEYYNTISGGYEIKAGADEVNWNERFYVYYYEDSDYYSLFSHLTNYRDGSSSSTIVRVSDSMAYCLASSMDDYYKFVFEDATGSDLLEICQDVSGDKAILSWKPVNGDTSPNNYNVENADVIYDADKNLFSATLTNLSIGTHTYSVSYGGQSADVTLRIFNHPGILQTEEELENLAERVINQEEPWYSDYQRLLYSVPNNLSSSDFVTTALEGVGRGTPSGHGNISSWEQAANAAYFNALQWVATGDSQYAETSVEILNDWAYTLKIIDGRDRILGAAISGYKFANAAEIMRYYHGGYEGYETEDFKAFQDMMENVVYPVIQDLGAPMIANGNWDTAAMICMISIGVLCDNAEIFDRATALYQDIHVNGSISVYVSDWGQSVESARDQAHAQLGIGYMAEVCQVALNQDVDLYSLYDNRLAKAFEWAAQYNLQYYLYEDDVYYDYDGEQEDQVYFEPLMNVFDDSSRGYWTTLDSESLSRGELRPVYELPLSYYSNVEGVDTTWMEKAAAAMRSQGYVHNDNLNFGTLTSYNGETTEVSQPYFQLRTRLEPWYQRAWSDGDPEVYASYFDINDDGELVASSMKKQAPFYQLINNQDGTYSILLLKTGTYLSVTDEMVGAQNIIRADAETIGANEKFVFQSNGAGCIYLISPEFDNRVLYVDTQGSDTDAILTLRLGASTVSAPSELENAQKLIFMYNSEDVALEGIETLPDVQPTTLDLDLNGYSNGELTISLGKNGSQSNAAYAYIKVEEGYEDYISVDASSLTADGTVIVTASSVVSGAELTVTFSGGNLDTSITTTVTVNVTDSSDATQYYTVNYSAGEGGSVASTHISGNAVASNSIISITATPNDDYIFSGWMVNGVSGGSANPGTFTITEDTSIIASFTYNKSTSGDGNSSSDSTNDTDDDDSDSSSSSSGSSSSNSSSSSTSNKTTNSSTSVNEESAVALVSLEDEKVALGTPIISELGIELTFINGYLNGYTDGTFRPDESLTRGQMAVILYQLVTDKGNVGDADASFNDLTGDEYYYEAIMFFANHKILSGYPDGTFRPDDSITRAEVAAILSYFFNSSENIDEVNSFSDISGHWAEESILMLTAKGIISGYPDGTFKPDESITRAEAVTLINKALAINSRELSQAKENKFTDLDESHWAYDEILVAIIN